MLGSWIQLIQLPLMLALWMFALCFDCCLWDCKWLQDAHQRKLKPTSDFHQGFCFLQFYCSANWGLRRSSVLANTVRHVSVLTPDEFSFSPRWFLHYIFIDLIINIQAILFAPLTNWLCLRALNASGTLWEVRVLMHYLLSAGEKHRDQLW